MGREFTVAGRGHRLAIRIDGIQRLSAKKISRNTRRNLLIYSTRFLASQTIGACSRYIHRFLWRHGEKCAASKQCHKKFVFSFHRASFCVKVSTIAGIAICASSWLMNTVAALATSGTKAFSIPRSQSRLEDKVHKGSMSIILCRMGG